MEQTRELKKAVLRTKISLTRKMSEAGYCPFSFRFYDSGLAEISARPFADADKGILAKLERELAELEAREANHVPV